jgi:hypothetical protein
MKSRPKALRLSLIFTCLALACFTTNLLASGQVRSNSSKSGRSAEWERIAKDLSTRFPQIRLSDLRLLAKFVDDLTVSGVNKDKARQLGMEAMAKGKALLPDNEQREMEHLNQEILDSYSPELLARIERLRIVVNNGQPMTVADQEFLMTQFKKGFENLPTQDRTRLQDLNGKAIRAFLGTQH